MTFPDKLNFAGIAVAGAGSAIAMVGAFLQMNGYFAFKKLKLFSELGRIVWAFRKGPTNGRNRIRIAAGLSKDTESRSTSLVGFYCVLFGFSLQMLGSVLMIWAILHGVEPPAHHAGG
ncbi:MAG TPA: hypothetical protein VII58_12165 [Acidobacteriaceae bacterium]